MICSISAEPAGAGHDSRRISLSGCVPLRLSDSTRSGARHPAGVPGTLRTPLQSQLMPLCRAHRQLDRDRQICGRCLRNALQPRLGCHLSSSDTVECDDRPLCRPGPLFGMDNHYCFKSLAPPRGRVGSRYLDGLLLGFCGYCLFTAECRRVAFGQRISLRQMRAFDESPRLGPGSPLVGTWVEVDRGESPPECHLVGCRGRITIRPAIWLAASLGRPLQPSTAASFHSSTARGTRVLSTRAVPRPSYRAVGSPVTLPAFPPGPVHPSAVTRMSLHWLHWTCYSLLYSPVLCSDLSALSSPILSPPLSSFSSLLSSPLLSSPLLSSPLLSSPLLSSFLLFSFLLSSPLLSSPLLSSPLLSSPLLSSSHPSLPVA